MPGTKCAAAHTAAAVMSQRRISFTVRIVGRVDGRVSCLRYLYETQCPRVAQDPQTAISRRAAEPQRKPSSTEFSASLRLCVRHSRIASPAREPRPRSADQLEAAEEEGDLDGGVLVAVGAVHGVAALVLRVELADGAL